MNTMTTTTDFSNQIANADHTAFFPALLEKIMNIFFLTGGLNSVDTALLTERIVQD